jgi:methionyl-tRNA formyltransferase
MGTPHYALPSLALIHRSRHHLLGVWTKPPSKTGRGMKVKPSPVATWAEENAIAYRESLNLKNEEELKVFQALNLDAALVVSYGIILPKAFLETPKLGIINLHPSLLPRWRGAAPLERALWAGDKQTGMTIMLLSEGIDDGDILAQEKMTIGTANADQLREQTSQAGARLLLKTLEDYAAKKIIPQKQNHSLAVMAEKLPKEARAIDWNNAAEKILCQVRALASKPGAWFSYKGQRINLLEAEVVKAKGCAGEILDDKEALIACGQDGLKLLTLQRQGKLALPAKEFLLGFKLAQGDRLN